MSEQTTETPTDTEQTPQAGTEQQQDQPKTFDADYVANLRKEAAKYRTEAKANADAAKKLAEIEEANKSEIDKALDRVTKAEAEVASLPARVADALKAHLVTLHEINDEDAELFLTANDPDLLLKQVARLTQRNAEAAAAQETERKKRGNHVPREGATTTASENDGIQAVRGLFGS